MKFVVEVEVIDKIRPSSLTPPHIRRHDLSFLDQMADPIFLPFLLFYHDDHLTMPEQKLAHIKQSLSKALSVFYPLAGTLKLDENHVDCNDRGIYYIQARACCRLSYVLEDPDPESLKPLVPFELHNISDRAAAVQVTSFDCGGLSVCLCISHRVGDARSCITFLNCWAAIARKDMNCEPFIPDFGSAKLFPPTKLPDHLEPLNPILKEDFVTKRFVFGPSSISMLRDKFTDPEKKLRPSRVGALQAFFWKCHMDTMQRKKYLLVEPVNLRQRINLSDRHFGNLVITLKNRMELDDAGECNIVSQVRELITNVDTDYVKLMQNTDEYLKKEMEIQKEACEKDMLPIIFTSLCRFPMYEVDMGWGKPAWVTTVGLPLADLVIFWDAKDGVSIEVYVTMRENDMAKFEKNEELLSYVSTSSTTEWCSPLTSICCCICECHNFIF